MKPASALVVLAVLLVVGCGEQGQPAKSGVLAASSASHALALDSSRTRPPGLGERYRPPPFGVLVATRAPVDGLRCGTAGQPYGAHIELFADAHEIVVPAGIGIAPPQHHQGARVDTGGCVYPVRTTDPTGVILIDPSPAGSSVPTVGEFFKLWGQALTPRRVGSFTVPGNRSIAAFIDGRRFAGDPDSIPLRRHTQIVLEVGPRVEPHPSYRFPSGL